ncbi:DUF362 domain-containing protein [Oscillibacter sp.]|uniref:DUF362 domain-containing protein n=1 Tax=Oscillibacter sp. TaxID=1945593 RepID=UPI00339AD869
MKTITNLIENVPIPRMVRVRENFDRTCIHEIPATILRELDREELGGRILPGMKIAITCGSRGINHNALMARAMVDFVKSRGAEPFIVAAMGSHGGATAEGQLQILKDYGVTEEAMGCPVKSCMDTVEIGVTEKRHQHVRIDKNAAEADGILLFNRIKPHTSFRGPYESGLMKMMAIGLGKQVGANALHSQSPAIMHELVEEYGRTILKNAPVLGGIAVVENAYDETYLIRGLTPQEIIDEEPKLKELSYKTIAHLLFDKCDVLVVDQIGKNISGDGMDPNISGRFVLPQFCSGGIAAEKVVILDLTDETHGNAQGIGLAEVTTRRLFNKMNLEMTYPTGVTNTFLHLMKIPMIMDNDREAMQLALCCCPEAEDQQNLKMIRIRNTAHIDEIEISEALLPLAKANPNIEILSEPYDLKFDREGNLF